MTRYYLHLLCLVGSTFGFAFQMAFSSSINAIRRATVNKTSGRVLISWWVVPDLNQIDDKKWNVAIEHIEDDHTKDEDHVGGSQMDSCWPTEKLERNKTKIRSMKKTRRRRFNLRFGLQPRHTFINCRFD